MTKRQESTEHRVVVTYSPATHTPAHQRATHMALAERLAALKGCDFGGEYDPTRQYGGHAYFLPADTIATGCAETLGIHSEHDLFGGVVPYRFVATKSISHSLVDPSAYAPDGWSTDLARHLNGAVLPGFSCFTLADAHTAGAHLLKRGPVRMKPGQGIGGRGQTVLRDADALRTALAALDPMDLTAHGMVFEQNLDDAMVYSVGEVQVGALCAGYFGTQSTTTDNDGARVYGGSDLTIMRGGLIGLLDLDLEPYMRLAIDQARAYEAAVSTCFPAWFASRRNYDVAQGRAADGGWRSGVLEQSWRIGGASPAEIAALAALRANPATHLLRAACFEVYGPHARLPAQASVHFQGVDDHVGAITKYAHVETYVNAR